MSTKSPSIDGLAIVSFALLGLMLLSLFTDLTVTKAAPAPVDAPVEVQVADLGPVGGSEQAVESPAAADQAPDPAAFAAPYADYIITQGPHGQSYGHYAIDLGNGKGAAILSPIHGMISARYMDGLGNTVLVIENEIFVVTLMHGEYFVEEGEFVALGDPVGVESNQGNTVDFDGRSCRGRDCGYHTHLNVFDKRLEENVNPLELFGVE